MRNALTAVALTVLGCAQPMDQGGPGAPDAAATSGSAGANGGGSSGATGGAGNAGTGNDGAGLTPFAGFVAVPCDKASTTVTTLTFASGAAPVTTSYTTYYADVPLAGLNPASPPMVRALACGADAINTMTPTNGYTTTTSHMGDVDPNGPSTCYEVSPSFATGHVYVGCGYSTADGSGGVTKASHSKVYVSM